MNRFILCQIAAVVLTVVSSKSKQLTWLTNNAGFFSQYLHMKIMIAIGKQYNRTVLVPEISTLHFRNTKVSLCELLQFPDAVQCYNSSLLLFRHQDCMNNIDPSILGSDVEIVCYNGELPLFGQSNSRETIVMATTWDPAFVFQPNVEKMARYFKDRLYIKSQTYTVVHWRRGDQLTARCAQGKDNSVNCGSAAQLTAKIRRSTNDTTVFIATNENPRSAYMSELREAGFRVFDSANITSFTGVQAFMVEIFLMIDASTFLGWGVSECNDVVEYVRMKMGKSYCLTTLQSEKEPTLTWCETVRSQSQPRPMATAATIINTNRPVIPPGTKAQYEFPPAVLTASSLASSTTLSSSAMLSPTPIITPSSQSLNSHLIQSNEEKPQDLIHASLKSPLNPMGTQSHKQQPQTRNQQTKHFSQIPQLFDHRKEYNTSQSRRQQLLWLPDKDGLFSQYLQLKLKFKVAQKFGRTLVIPPIISHHFNNTPVNLCEIFILPASIQCLKRSLGPAELGYKQSGCMNLLEVNFLKSSRRLCYRGPLPYFGTKDRKDAVLLSLVTPAFPLATRKVFNSLVIKAKSALNIGQRTNFTVVHWRRGDQLTVRCQKSHRDKSVNCGPADDLVALVRSQSADSIVYVATNEAKGSAEIDGLREHGFKTWVDLQLGRTSMVQELMLETILMLGATTFLGFGVSEVNDVVDFERQRMNKTWCVTKEPWMHSYKTFCNSVNIGRWSGVEFIADGLEAIVCV